MACHKRLKQQKSKAFHRKLHILRDLIHSNSDKTSSIIMDAFICIQGLKLKLEALERESMNRVKQMNHRQLPLLEVIVEKQSDENRFRVNVRSERGKDNLVNILQAFEEKGVNVIHAKVSSINHFAMEAIVEVSHNNVDSQAIDATVLTQFILKAIQSSTTVDT